MNFRVVLDARRIRDFGIGTYIRNLVLGLGRIDTVNEYVLVLPEEEVQEFDSLPPNFERTVYSKTETSPFRHLQFSLFLKKFKPDVYHEPLNNVPLWMPKPYIVTIHDMGSLLFETGHGFRNNLQLYRLRRGLLRADQVISVSAATRRDVESVLGIPGDRIRTIYNAPDPLFFSPRALPVTCVGEQDVHNPPEMQRVLERYQIHYPFLLYVGRTNPHKNIPRLVEAFSVLRGQLKEHPLYHDLRLIVIGDHISRHKSLRLAVIQSKVEDSVRFLGFVPIETLCVFYQAASAFVFPSLYEGFGLPPLEAMACGTPVVCSQVSSLPEVVGDAAVTVNPENVFDIARGIRETLLDHDLRRRMIEKGFQQLRRFSWDTSARQVLETYREVIARTGTR
jgi:glycosyltransferase involved in cell wall biosynthesis